MIYVIFIIIAYLFTVKAANVVQFGDSWAALFGGGLQSEFEQMFRSRGYNVTVANRAIGGTTAEYYARTPNSLLNRIDPDTQWVWISIGGNDGIYGLPGTPIDELIEQVIEWEQVFVDPVLEERPDVHLVQFGYDIVDFCTTCASLGNSLFPSCDGELSCWNEEMQALQLIVDRLADIYSPPRAPSGFFNNTNLLGTMQAASGEVPPPYPNLNYCTPKDLMNDCIHPNSPGYDALFDALWEEYFQYEDLSAFKMQ